jgi:hypothetical protein
MSFSYTGAPHLVSYISLAKPDALPDQVMDQLLRKARGLAVAHGKVQGTSSLSRAPNRALLTHLTPHARSPIPTDLKPTKLVGTSVHVTRKPIDVALIRNVAELNKTLCSPSYSPIVCRVFPMLLFALGATLDSLLRDWYRSCCTLRLRPNARATELERTGAERVN